MIAVFLFLTAYPQTSVLRHPQTKIEILKKESIWETDISKNFVSKTNYSIQVNDLIIPSIIIPSDLFEEINMIIPYQFKVKLHGYLKYKIKQFFEKYIPKDLYKVDSILEQLEKYRPTEIEYFNKIVSSTERAEKISDILDYLPYSNYYNIFQYDPTDYRYAYTYKYSSLFESYHQFFECSQTGRSFLVKGIEDEDKQLLVTKISNSYEIAGDTFLRTFENLKYIINNFEEIEFKYEDPYQILNKNYAEFLSSCEKLIKMDKENGEHVKIIRKEVSDAVIDFISCSNEVVYETVDIFGIKIPVLLKSSATPNEGGPKIDCFYMNKQQALSAIEQLDDNITFFQKVCNFFHTLFVLFICFLLKSCSIKNYAAFLLLSSSLLNEMRRDNTFYSPIFDWIGSKVNNLLCSSSRSQARQDDELLKARKLEETNANGREMMMKIIKRSIKGHEGPFILKIEKSAQASFKAASLLLFSKI